MVEDVTRDGKYVTPIVDSLTDEGAKRSRPCKRGTMTIVCSGTVGIPSFLSVDACINDGFLALVDLKSSIYDDYLYHQLITLRDRFELSATHGGVFINLTTTIIREFKVAIPPIAEQRAIATALRDVDAVLDSLDRLIAKNRDTKQAAMQQLLTGCRRLLGFNIPWKLRRLGEVTQIKTGKKNTEDKSIDGRYPFFVRSQTVERIDSFSFDGEAVLVPGEGGIGSIFHYMNGKFDYHQRFYKISDFDKDTVGKFIYYVMVRDFHGQATRNSVKATVDSLRLPTFKEFEFLAPSRDEQVAIADVLTDMDAEIEALEARREKTRAIKQGMMQELLTGRTRLV
jgi:type I restriction enzyme S subunit